MITGVGTHVWNVCRGLQDIDFEIFAPAMAREKASESLFSNARIIRVPPRAIWSEYYPPPFHPRFSPVVDEFLQVIRLERMKRILRGSEIVHNHMAPFEFLYRLGSRPGLDLLRHLAHRELSFSASKVITTDHSLFSHLSTPEGLRGRYTDIARSLLANSDVIICVEPSGVLAAQELADSQGEAPRVVYVPNSVDTKLFIPAEVDRPRERFRVGYCGRASKPGYEFVAQVADGLPAGTEMWACVAGSHRSLQKWDLLRTQHKVRLFHNLPSEALPVFYNSLDCLLNPISVPGMSLATLEAMACGVPVIMIEGDRYPVEHRRTGLLVDRNPPAMIKAIGALRDDQILCHHLAQMARAKVLEEFSSEEILPRLAREYAG